MRNCLTSPSATRCERMLSRRVRSHAAGQAGEGHALRFGAIARSTRPWAVDGGRVAEDTAVGGHQPVAGGCGVDGQAHDRRYQGQPAGRSVEPGITEGEDAVVAVVAADAEAEAGRAVSPITVEVPVALDPPCGRPPSIDKASSNGALWGKNPVGSRYPAGQSPRMEHHERCQGMAVQTSPAFAALRAAMHPTDETRRQAGGEAR
jgi:hypothetical protein